MRCRKLLACLLLLCCLPLAACAKKLHLEPVPEPALQPFGMDEQLRPIAMTALTVKMRRQEVMGTVAHDGLCARRTKLTSDGVRENLSRDELVEIFTDEATDTRLMVTSDARTLFPHPDTSQAELWIGGNITELYRNVCYPLAGWGNPIPSKGEARITVDWEVFSPLDRRVVLRRTTSGYAELDDAIDGGWAELLRRSFAQSVRGLLADEEFRALVTVTQGKPAASQPPAARQEARPDLSGVRVRVAGADAPAMPLDDVRNSAVLVQMGNGHGSGFIITPDGYMLTNHHVVKEAARVRVRLQNGVSVVADVVAREERRDVALLKADMLGVVPLYLQLADVGTGDDLFPVGAPLEEHLQGNISKGIASGYRFFPGEGRLLQSDAATYGGNSGGPVVNRHGHVVGIVVSGYRGDVGDKIGVNNFIPIADALKTLGIATGN